MAVVFRATAAKISGGGLIDPGEPAGTASGDWLIGGLAIDSASATVGLPSGWTSLSSATVGAFKYAFGYIARGGSAAATQFTGDSAQYYEVHIVGVRSDTAGTITLDAQSSVGSTGNAATKPNPPAVVAVATSSLALCIGVHWNGSVGGWTAPAGYTIRSDNTAGNDLVMATKSLSASGSEDPAIFTSGTFSAADLWNGMTITLADGSGVPDLAVGLGSIGEPIIFTNTF